MPSRRQRRGWITVHSKHGEPVTKILPWQVKPMFKDGQIEQAAIDGKLIWIATKDFPFRNKHPLYETTGETIEKIAAEKFPLILQGGLTRTETNPVVKPYPTRWPATTT